MTKIIGAVAAAVLSLSASSALAATLTNVSVTLSNNAPSQPTAITAKHTIAAPVDPAEFILRYALPAGFTKIVNVHQATAPA